MSIQFGEYKHSTKYNNGTMDVISSPLLFRNVFTFGVQKSKFDAKKFTITLCLDGEQLKVVESAKDKCLEELKKQDISVSEIKYGLYGEKIYVKADPESFSTYKGDDELDFEDVLKLKNFHASVGVDVRSVYVSKGIAHLQLYLYELVVLPSQEEKPKVKRERLLF